MALRTPAQRAQVLERLVEALRADERLDVVVFMGTGADGFRDDDSDIDFALIVADGHTPAELGEAWRRRMADEFGARHGFSQPFGEAVDFRGYLLDGFLEVDLAFAQPAAVTMIRRPCRVLLDRSGAVAAQLAEPPAAAAVDVEARYRQRLSVSWYTIGRVAIGTHRGQPWSALPYLDDIRRGTLALAALRDGRELEWWKDAGDVSAELGALLAQSLPASTDEREVLRALRAAAEAFFGMAVALDQQLGLADHPGAALRATMADYLDAVEARAQP